MIVNKADEILQFCSAGGRRRCWSVRWELISVHYPQRMIPVTPTSGQTVHLKNTLALLLPGIYFWFNPKELKCWCVYNLFLSDCVCLQCVLTVVRKTLNCKSKKS